MAKIDSIQLLSALKSENVMMWCGKCNAKLVKAVDSRTGKFFLQFGCKFNGIHKKPVVENDYNPILYSICSDCL